MCSKLGVLTPNPQFRPIFAKFDKEDGTKTSKSARE